jgi:hypothetical protein
VRTSTAEQCRELSLALQRLITASIFLKIRSDKLNVRVMNGMTASAVACDGVLLALPKVRERAVAAAQAKLRTTEKVLDEQLEEVSGNENILMAVAALSEARTHSLRLMSELEAVASLLRLFFNEIRNQNTRPLMSLRSPGAIQLDRLLVLHRNDVDPARVGLGGLGLQRFMVGAAVPSNVITVTPYTTSGVLAEFITSDDVSLSFTSVSGAPIECDVTVTENQPGEIRAQYCISAQHDVRVTEIRISVEVCNHLIGQPLCVKLGYDASSTRAGICLHGADGGKAGLAVTDNASLLATSDYEECVLRIFELSPRVKLLNKIGGRGSQPGQLLGPCRLCFTPAGNLLVCELSNNRVQHLTAQGQSLHCTALPGAYAIANSPRGASSRHDSLSPVAVSTRYGTIELRMFSGVTAFTPLLAVWMYVITRSFYVLVCFSRLVEAASK